MIILYPFPIPPIPIQISISIQIQAPTSIQAPISIQTHPILPFQQITNPTIQTPNFLFPIPLLFPIRLPQLPPHTTNPTNIQTQTQTQTLPIRPNHPTKIIRRIPPSKFPHPKMEKEFLQSPKKLDLPTIITAITIITTATTTATKTITIIVIIIIIIVIIILLHLILPTQMHLPILKHRMSPITKKNLIFPMQNLKRMR
jgi:hypothetical protein